MVKNTIKSRFDFYSKRRDTFIPIEQVGAILYCGGDAGLKRSDQHQPIRPGLRIQHRPVGGDSAASAVPVTHRLRRG